VTHRSVVPATEAASFIMGNEEANAKGRAKKAEKEDQAK
jgi:hypothetical protein